MNGTTDRLSSRWTRLASAGSRIAVRPGISTSRSSQRSIRVDDDVAVGLLALAPRAHTRLVLEPDVHDPPLDRRHRLQLDRVAGGLRLIGAADGQRFQRLPPPRAVPGC